jgi:hypothetical protein
MRRRLAGARNGTRRTFCLRPLAPHRVELPAGAKVPLTLCMSTWKPRSANGLAMPVALDGQVPGQRRVQVQHPLHEMAAQVHRVVLCGTSAEPGRPA